MNRLITNVSFVVFLFLINSVNAFAVMGDDKGSLSQNLTHADNFVLLDQDGNAQELYYYSDQKAVVLIWQGNGCPIIRKYVAKINDLKKRYESKGVVFLMVNANPQDDRFAIQKEVKEFGIEVPVLEDDAQVMTSGFGVRRTAEAILVDVKGWKIAYHGAIDDGLGDGAQRKVENDYLNDAIESVLKGREVKVSTTEAKGCLINVEGETKEVSYSKEVAPILIKKCLECHSPGGAGPWSMDDYEKVRGFGPMIREVVRTKRMPPFKPDPYYGLWKDDASLKPEEVRTLVQWIEGGMKKEEDEKDPLVTVERPKHGDWQLGNPDVVIDLPEQRIPATGTVPYRYLLSDYVVPEDMWVRGCEILTSNLKATHHVLVWIIEPDKLKQVSSLKEAPFDNDTGYNFISVYVPGRFYDFHSVDTGFILPKGGRFFIDQHYTATGKPEIIQSKLGLYLHKEKPKKKIFRFTLQNTNVVVPPYQKDKLVVSFQKIKEDILLLRLNPHAHYRGKAMKYTAIYPDGREEILLSVPQYDFNWQHIYYYRTPKLMPAGTVIKFETRYDNSLQNPLNPDPSQEVRHGRQSTDEMSHGHIYYTKVHEIDDQ